MKNSVVLEVNFDFNDFSNYFECYRHLCTCLSLFLGKSPFLKLSVGIFLSASGLIALVGFAGAGHCVFNETLSDLRRLSRRGSLAVLAASFGAERGLVKVG